MEIPGIDISRLLTVILAVVSVIFAIGVMKSKPFVKELDQIRREKGKLAARDHARQVIFISILLVFLLRIGIYWCWC